MGTVHRLVIEHGKEAALKKVDPTEQHLVRVAADILAEEDDAIGVTYSGFCQASLPHKKLPDDKEWIRKSERLTLMIEPGRLIRPASTEGEFVGVPYGSRARLSCSICKLRHCARTVATSSSAGRCATGCEGWGSPRAEKHPGSQGSSHQAIHLQADLLLSECERRHWFQQRTNCG